MANSVAPNSDGDLDDRIRRLEATIARLSTTAVVASSNEDQLADRVLSKLAERASQHRGKASLTPDGLIHATIRTIYAPPITSETPPGTAEAPKTVETGIASWLLNQVFGEWKLMFSMYFDPRYRLSRLAQFGVPIILGTVVMAYFFFNYSCIIPIFNQVFERVFVMIMAVGLYKILAREVARYKQVLNYLAQYGFH